MLLHFFEFLFISTEQRIVARQRVAALLLLRRRLARRRRRVWVHPIDERREERVVYQNLVQELRADPERHRQYFRMNATGMDQILAIIGPDITKMDTNYRRFIEPKQKLAVTIR